jgi:site-specific recombinase
VEPQAAAHGLQGLNPLRSWTLPFAAFTGVLLWLSSLVAGWSANWSAFRRLPEALASQRRLRQWLGPARADLVGRLVQRHFSGVAGYLALGFLLGFMPVVFAFAGLKVEVRHVTLNAATLALCAAQDAPRWGEIAWALLGILVIGACNFGVSFYLALRTAMRARGLTGQGRLLLGLGRRFLQRPLTFLGPPEAEA